MNCKQEIELKISATFTVFYPHWSWEIIRRISSGDLELISVLTRSLFGLHFWFCGLVLIWFWYYGLVLANFWFCNLFQVFFKRCLNCLTVLAFLVARGSLFQLATTLWLKKFLLISSLLASPTRLSPPTAALVLLSLSSGIRLNQVRQSTSSWPLITYFESLDHVLVPPPLF